MGAPDQALQDQASPKTGGNGIIAAMKDSPRRNAASLPLLVPAALVLGLLAGCDITDAPPQGQVQGQVQGQGQAQQRPQPLQPSTWTLTKPQPATAPRVAEPYPIQPRGYPEQTNTTPVGWVSPEERAAQEKAAEERRAAERKAAEEKAAQVAAAPPPPATTRNTRGSQQSRPAAAPSQPQAQRQAAPAAAKPAETMAASAANPGRWHAHLASHRSEEAAINDWQARLKANPQAYTELEPAILWVDLPNRGSYARLVAGNFASKAEADAACAKLGGPGRYCTAVVE